MAKRNRKAKMTAEEVEAQRVEAHIAEIKVDEITGTVKVREEPAELEHLEESVEEERAPHPANDAVDIVPEWKEEDDTEESFDEGDPSEEDEEKPEPNSIVKEKFKLKYIENAKATGAVGKAARRSNWDWLAQRIAEECLGEKEKINIESFQDLLDANGVDWSKWTNRNKGWEGRFRMTGRVALQRIVAEKGELKTMAGISVPPPDWILKYKKV
jgi:dynactin complex subunit